MTDEQIEDAANEYADSIEKHICAYRSGLKQGFIEATKRALSVSVVVGQSKKVCDNPHCQDGTVQVIYGEPLRCSICDKKNTCPECGEQLIEKWSGVKCSKCEYWFCF